VRATRRTAARVKKAGQSLRGRTQFT
jgi:hypothetical protein